MEPERGDETAAGGGLLRLLGVLLLACPLLTASGQLLAGSVRHVQLDISHPVFLIESSHLQSGLTYQVAVRSVPRVRGPRLSATASGGEAIFSGPGPPVNFTVPPLPQGNITFRIIYHLEGDPAELEVRFNYIVAQDCELMVGDREKGRLTLEDLPDLPGCTVKLQSGQDKSGFIINLEKLNVPCSQGRIRLLPQTTQLCGKLEELPDTEFYFPSEPPEIRVEGRPTFGLTYSRVDPCHNVTLRGRNGSLELGLRPSLECAYSVLLPYGYRVGYTLQIGEREPAEFYEPLGQELTRPCSGLSLEVRDPEPWYHCAGGGGDAQRAGGLREVRRLSGGNVLRLQVVAGPRTPGYLVLRLRYEAAGTRETTGGCGWPSIASGRLCVWLSSDVESWAGAEAACSAHGGHLASITGQQEQDLLQRLISNSPDYRETEAVWVGGSDMSAEGDFRWTDSRPFTYTNWFGGRKDGRHRQPSDDGLSGEDCLELRSAFGGESSAAGLKWNDRDCSARNKYVCECLPGGERMPSLKEMLASDCNKTLSLSLEEPSLVVTSPGFPDLYPGDSACITVITAPSQFPIVVDFEELVLESEPSCSYDYVEVSGANGTERLCGDLSDRLKLLRQVLAGPKLRIKFVSDYSHNFQGFKAYVSLARSWPECGRDKLWPRFNDSCYLVVSYPEVSWATARKICNDIKGELASLHSTSEERFVVTKIRESLGYSTSAAYWLGGRRAATGPVRNGTEGADWAWPDGTGGADWAWLDGTEADYAGTMVEQSREPCLALQYAKSPGPQLPSGLYWTSQPCDMVGGYICKKKDPGLNELWSGNRTLRGTEGTLTSPGYPEQYPHGADEYSRIVGPPGHRLVLAFERLDLEPQPSCLYDWLEVESPRLRLCGYRTRAQLRGTELVTDSNIAIIWFHSDYSVSGGGWALGWRAVDVTGCPLRTTTSKQGVLVSPNYPHFLLSRLDCATTVLAPEGKRVLIELEDWDVPAGGLEVELGGGAGRLVPFSSPRLLSDGAYVSNGERLQLTLKTGDSPQGRGFKALYKTVGEEILETRVVEVRRDGQLLHLNYPLEPPTGADFTLRLIVPLGYLIQLHFHLSAVDESCGASSNEARRDYLEVTDPYGETWTVCGPLTLTSYLNTLRVRQVFGSAGFPQVGIRLNATLTLIQDPEYRRKLMEADQPLESCVPNPCQNGGLCVTSAGGHHSCRCLSHFVGLLCGLTACETEPCQFGNCSLDRSGYACHCYPGYTGKNCDLPLRPCASNPCDSRGECVQTNRTAFKCRCHAWWEGARCERRMMHIPYKPLSARMLQEPFWLGLITVMAVLGIIGLFWCAKRHFPEKLEKLLAEEDSRRSYSSRRWNSGRREPSQLGPRSSLLGRLGIRKQSVQAPAPAVRTFSLDDLLRPPTPSPRKKRNNSTPTKKSCGSEKKQILQQLVSADPLPPLVVAASGPAQVAETSFSSATRGGTDSNSKLEKKVTFARLLDKVSSEMSSGSELETAGTGGDGGGGRGAGGLSSSPPSSHEESRSSSDTQLHHGSPCMFL